MNLPSVPSSHDNIAALSSGQGLAALAVIRISGPKLKDILGRVLSDGGCLRKPRRLVLDQVLDESGEVIDQVLAVFFPGPASYTGEDMAELHCHGGRAVYGRILQRLFALGCREALPGEFTRRAFENGKMDLTRAEAVMHIINARTPQQVKAAARVLTGKFQQRLENLRRQLEEALAVAEALIDFPDEEIDFPLEAELESLAKELGEIRKSLFLAGGGAVEIAILGRQNVGKSSLLNRLAGRELALVTPVAGTTRDAVRFRTELAGREVEFLDTAGLSPKPADELDRLSQEKTRKDARQAALALWVFEATEFTPPPDWCSRPILVANKIDLLEKKQKEGLEKEVLSRGGVMLSALSGEGVENLLEKIAQRLEEEFGPQEGIPVSWQQAEAIDNLVAAIRRAKDEFHHNQLLITAEELRRAMGELGRLLGQEVTPDVLDMIFSRFCIGK